MKTEKQESPLTGSVWKLEVSVNQVVIAGDLLMTLESMKMEIPVEATVDGTVSAIHVKEGDSVEVDQLLLTIEVP